MFDMDGIIMCFHLCICCGNCIHEQKNEKDEIQVRYEHL